MATTRNAVANRIKNAGFPVLKDFDTYDFTALPNLSKPKVLRTALVVLKSNCCLVGVRNWKGSYPDSDSGSQRVVRACGSTNSSAALSWSAGWRRSKKQYTLDRFLFSSIEAAC